MEFTERVTHNLRLHLDNDEGIYREFQYCVPRIHAKVSDYGNGLIITTERVTMLAEWLRDYCYEALVPEYRNPNFAQLAQQDLIQCALAWVDWDDMAESYAEQFPEEPVEDDEEEGEEE